MTVRPDPPAASAASDPAGAPPRYTAFRVAEPPALDGRLASACWARAPRSSRFVDLVSGGETAHDTRTALLWDDENLYVACWLEQPRVTATLTERDSEIWHDDDVELFVAGPDPEAGRAYYELEVNALNTVYEAVVAWGEQDAPFGADAPPELHRAHARAAPFDGVDYDHPRGRRTIFLGWDLPGLRTAVHVDGRLNDPAVDDRGWTVEMAVPWRSLGVVSGPEDSLVGRAPHPGDEWGVAVARFNVTRHGSADSGGWSWAAHGVWDSHRPELFPRIRFAAEAV